MKHTILRLLSCALLLTAGISGHASTITNTDPTEGGIGYAWTADISSTDSGTFKDHVGAWSWEDNSLFSPGQPSVGWTHTSKWLAVNLQKATVLTITMAADATVSWPAPDDAGRLADTASMFPSLTLWKGWDNDGDDFHMYNNRGNVSWAEDLAYLDHVDNSTQASITRTWVLPAGQYTIVLGSNAPANNALRQGFSFSFTSAPIAAVDPVPNTAPESAPATGGVGYGYTVAAAPGESGSIKDHVGAWSWEDNALFAPGQPPVGWTHTSKWVAVRVLEDSLFTVTMDRDATVPWPSQEEPDRLADTTSMFPSLTLWRGWDNDGGDSHTYNNRGKVAWAEDLNYLDHIDNSTATSVSRTWRLKAGEYSFVLGSNAPANNSNRQGFSFNWSAAAIAPITSADPAAGGIGYAYTLAVGAGDTGSFKDHVGAWSWEDNALFAVGEPPVGWTHTSKWVALNLKDPVTFTVTMERDATVPWVNAANTDPNQLADTSSMFPSLTLWKGWDNDGSDSHKYNNRGNVDWAEDISYIDHIDNSTKPTITRSWTLQPGNYTFALGSNAPATNVLRQGFKFSYATSAPVYLAPVITKQPLGLSLNEGQTAVFNVTATGPSLSYQWFKDDVKIDSAIGTKLTIDTVALSDAATYTVEVRNAAGAVVSKDAVLAVVAKPVVNTPGLPDARVGQVYSRQITATNNPTRFAVTGKMPTGLVFNSTTGQLSGRLLAGGSFSLTFTATNRAGTSEKVTDSFDVFTLLPGTVGSFTGVIARSPSLNGFLGGSIRIAPTGTGSFTGSLVLGAKTYPLSGPLTTGLAVASSGSQIIVRSGQPSIVLAFAIDTDGRVINGQVQDGPQSVAFSARMPSSAALAYPGNYTHAQALDGADAGNAAVPQGYGFGSFKVAAGTASGVINLSDETKITFAGPVEQGGNISVFSLLYNKLGSLIAVYNINSSAHNTLADSEMDWLKLPEANTSKGRVYKQGFGPLSLTVIGGPYIIPSAGNRALGLAAGTGNARLIFAEGGAPDPATRLNVSTITVQAGSPTTPAIAAPNPGTVTLKITPGSGTIFTTGTTGSFSGGFKLTDSDTSVMPNKPLTRTVTFNGVIVNDGVTQKGYGCFLLPEMPVASPKTTILTSPKLSGSVLLEATALVP